MTFPNAMFLLVVTIFSVMFTLGAAQPPPSTSSSITITVDENAVDGPSDPNSCDPPTTDCNFRSAWDYCANTSNWLTPSVIECTINVPEKSSGGSYEVALQNLQEVQQTDNQLSDVTIASSIDNLVIPAFTISIVGTGTLQSHISGTDTESLLIANIVQDFGSVGDAPKVHVSISNMKFSSFGAGTSAGGCLAFYSFESLTITNSVFDSCTGTNGGALFTSEINQISITDSTFNLNIGTGFQGDQGDGGALYVKVEVPATRSFTVANCEFTRNRGTSGGAAFFSSTENLMLTGVSFIENEATASGGAVHVGTGGDNTIVSNCSFVSNSVSVVEGGVGGGLSFDSSSNSVTLTDNVYSLNSAYSGGGLYVGDSCTMFTITNMTATDNVAVIGAGVTFEGVGNNLGHSITDSVFRDNNATDDGGAIALIKSVDNFQLLDTILSGNYAGIHGGMS
jgi:predicted outer membrane repeat protein